MESKWYLFADQSLEKTKISDRAHALHCSKTAWNGITKHLDRKKLIQEQVDRENALKKYLADGSRAMTTGWENSLENVRKRKEEERLKMIEQKKDDRMQKFLVLRKEQEEVRRQYREKVQKQIFMSSGYAKDLTSALVTSEVLYQREKQIELQNKIKEHEKTCDNKYVEKMKKDAEEEEQEKLEREIKQKETALKHGEELKKTIEERIRIERCEKERHVKDEALDNIKAKEEMDELDQLREMDKLKKRTELALERKRLLKVAEQKKQRDLQEDREIDEVVQIYRDAKHKIDCMRKQKEKEMRDVVTKRREEIAKLVYKAAEDKTEAEERIIKKATEEREAKELEKIKARKELDEKLKEERIHNRQEWLEKEEERKRKEKEILKWELLNRYKTDEHTKKYEEQKKMERWNEIVAYRNEILEQLAENEAERKREQELERAFVLSSMSEDDGKFFEYANEVMELAKRKGRSTYPIEKVIEKYVKENNLKPGNVKSCGSSQEDDLIKLKKKLIAKPKTKKCRCECAYDCKK